LPGVVVEDATMRILALFLLAALSTQAEARTATGYRGGQKVQLKVVEVGGAEVEVKTAKAFKAMARAARKAGVELAVRSGFRSHAKQTRLYKKYRRGVGNLAARPGFSQHESGRALDLVVVREKTYQWLVSHANEFGFHRSVRGEPWHWEYFGDSAKTAVELGVSANPIAAGTGGDYGEYPCTRELRFARPVAPLLLEAPADEQAPAGVDEQAPTDADVVPGE
jgi:D-alanyl-D-alanine carboxypeptidase